MLHFGFSNKRSCVIFEMFCTFYLNTSVYSGEPFYIWLQWVEADMSFQRQLQHNRTCYEVKKWRQIDKQGNSTFNNQTSLNSIVTLRWRQS